MTSPDKIKLAQLRTRAAARYASDDIEIDGTLQPEDISEVYFGTWVRAWVWIPNDTEQEGNAQGSLTSHPDNA